MAGKNISVGLIGYGFAGKTLHAPLIKAVDGLALGAVASSDAAKVERDLPDIPIYSDPGALIACRDIAMVVIATPNDSHAPLARAAIEAGKHVVIDKPFALDLAQARELVGLAQKHDVWLSVFQNRRWDSDFLGVCSTIESGALGLVTHFESHFDRYRPEIRDRWREHPIPGAGVWFDLSPHLIDQVLTLFGLPDSISAEFNLERSNAKATDWAHAVLAYSRRRIVLHATMLAAGGSARFIVHGEKGSFVKRGSDQQEAQLLRGMKPGAPGWGDDSDLALLWDTVGAPREVPMPTGDYRLYYANFRDALMGRGSLEVPPIQALAVMAVLQAGNDAAVSGKRTIIPFTEEERRAYQESRKRRANLVGEVLA